MVQDLDVAVHQLTIQLDEHTYNAHAMQNRAGAVYHHVKENGLLDRKFEQTVRLAVDTMDRGTQMEEDSIIACGKVEADAQRFVKVQNIRLT